ncbi:MAG: alpha/beta fold hydrolase [Frankia sp.]|nr:alpha/beta fold hydrolase [Frankia sp.]
MPVRAGAEPYHHDGGAVGALLVHGFTGSPAALRPWAEQLAAAGLTVRVPRLPGHGTTWQEMNLTRWQDWYGEIERAFDELIRRCERVFVMGLSMGGALSLRIAECKGDEVAGLVLVNPSVLPVSRLVKVLPVLKFVVKSIKAISNDIKRPDADEVAYDRTPLVAAASLADLWRVVTPELARVNQPLLVYRSATDHVLTGRDVEALLAAVSSTDVQEVVLHDSYHVATLDNDRQQIYDGSLAFVRERAGVPI